MFFSVSSATLRGNLARKQEAGFRDSLRRYILLFLALCSSFEARFFVLPFTTPSLPRWLCSYLSATFFFPFSCIPPIVASDWLMVAGQPAKQTDRRRRGPPSDCKQDGHRAVVRTMASFQQTQLVLVCYSFEGPSCSLFTKEMRTKNEGNGGTNRLPTITSNCKFTSEE